MSALILTNELKDVPDVPCWCGEPHPYYAPIRRTCGGTGHVDCLCGGDFCVCHNHGEVECYGCHEIIDNKLYLELSQVADAETEKELIYREALDHIKNYPNVQSTANEGLMRAIADQALRRAKSI